MKKKLVSSLLVLLLVLSLLIPNNVQAATVKLNKSSVTLYISESVKLKLNGTSSKIIWKSSNKSIASVSNGKVTAKDAGSTTITAVTTNNKKKYSCKVTVKKRLSSNKYSVNCGLNDDYQEIIVSYRKLKEKEAMFFEVENQDIATVDYEDIGNNKVAVYIIPNKSGNTKLKIYTGKYDRNNTYYGYTINDTDCIEININVGISESDEWIGENTLDSVYDIYINVFDDQISLYKREKNSLTGNSDFLYEFTYEINYKNNTIYGDNLRYKFIDNEIFFSIPDLKKLNIIS